MPQYLCQQINIIQDGSSYALYITGIQGFTGDYDFKVLRFQGFKFHGLKLSWFHGLFHSC